MRHYYPYLNNPDFLLSLHREKIINLTVKMIILDFDEKPLRDIQGQITTGNINVDGKSAVRRTANLTAFIDNADATPMEIGGLFALNKKIKIEIGIVNNTGYYSKYPVLWFPQGVFAIVGASSSYSATGTTLSLQLKDKMVFLNGECGGTIPNSIIFHEYDELDPETGRYIKTKPPIVQIIRELVNHYGKEQLGRIMINDIPLTIQQVMRWLGEEPLYLHEDEDNKYFSLESPAEVNDNNTFSPGEDIGFINSVFYYDEDLISNPGESVCAILDKIKNKLGNYEYFYDLDGNFIFQEIKNYLNTSQSTLALGSIDPVNYLVDRTQGKAVYSFDDSHIITSFSNSPQYNNIKNDFVIWGNRKYGDGQKAIRYHLAIDSKPVIKEGESYKCYLYRDPEEEYLGLPDINELAKLPIEYDSFNDFPSIGERSYIYYDKSSDSAYYWSLKDLKYQLIEEGLVEIPVKDWRTKLYLDNVKVSRFSTDSNYYVDLVTEWPRLYDLRAGEWKVDRLSDIDYYLDFIDSTAAISKFSISNIGRRSHVVVDDKVNCLFESDIPDLLITLEGEAKESNSAFISAELNEDVATGGVKNSAFNLVKDLLYQYTGYNEAVVLQILPMYFLEPNIRIAARNKETGIYGEYMLNSFNIPLDINGTMSLSCTRALERI